MFKFYCILSCSFVVDIGAQLEYKVNYERLVLAHYEKSLIQDGGVFQFTKYNRTNFCLNVSFVLLKDIDGRSLECRTSAQQLLHNEYRDVGFSLTYNACKYWESNKDGFATQMKKYGNLEACDVKKGHYYIYNFMPDESYFPKYIPLGSYKIVIEVFLGNRRRLLTLEWYIKAEFKVLFRKFQI